MNTNTIAQDNMQDNTLENTRKKLIFRSWHRGTREIDLLLGRFADAHLPGFDAGELQQYEELLISSDPDLYNWITGKESPPANINGDVLQKLINFHN
jgi:antitoxin CptB